MVTRGRTYSSAAAAGSQQVSAMVGTGPTPVSPIRRPSPTHCFQMTRNRRVFSSQRSVTRSPTLTADSTFSISTPSRLRLVTRTRSRKARFFASIPQRLAVRVIGRRGWRRHPIGFSFLDFELIHVLRRAGGLRSGLQDARVTQVTAYRTALLTAPHSMRACPLPLRDASKAKDLYVGSVEKLQRDADRKRVRNPAFYPPVPTPTSLDYDEGN